MSININDIPSSLFLPVYNQNVYSKIKLEPDSTVTKVTEGKLTINYNSATVLSTPSIFGSIKFLAYNKFISDYEYFYTTIQPTQMNELLVFYGTVSSNLHIKQLLSSWVRTLNTSRIGNYFTFEVVSDDSMLTANNYIKYTPKQKYLRLEVQTLLNSNPTPYLVNSETTVNEVINEANLLFQPFVKVDLYTNSVAFPNTTNLTTKTLLDSFNLPVEVNPTTNDYTIPVNPFSLLKKYVKTYLPKLGGVRLQTEWMKRYWLEASSNGTVVTRIEPTSTPNAKASLSPSVYDIKLETGSSLARFVSNSARDYLRVVNTAPYYPTECDGAYNKVRFLTDQPNFKRVVYCKGRPFNQREFLSFLPISGTLSANIKLYFDNGTTTNISKSYGSVTEGTMITVDVSPDVLGFPDGDIIQWEIYFSINGNAYTETKSYVKLDNAIPNRYMVLFLNTLGGWDTFYFTGDNEFSVNFSSERFGRPITETVNSSSRINGTYNSSFSDGFQLNSNQLNKEEFEWLKQLAVSNDIYLFTTTFEAYYIESVDFKFDSFKSLYTANIRVRRTIDNPSINNNI